jgi:phosphoribosylformylglycinamidine synthase subunit PurL
MTLQVRKAIDEQRLRASGLLPTEYEQIVARLGREPNALELGMLGAMWSEHCGYKHSRRLLGRLPTSGPRVLQGPGENAGAVDIGDGLAVVLKMESHNHPSAVEPTQGAATGVGGIVRDVFTMGGRPVALLDSLRFGVLSERRTRYLLNGVVAGIGGYGNCLAGSESFVWRDARGAVHVETLGSFVDGRLPDGQSNAELCEEEAETLSLDPQTLRSCWRPVRRVFRRTAGSLVRVQTAIGGRLSLTPDHPVLGRRGGVWTFAAAGDLRPGDRLGLVPGPPATPFEPRPESSRARLSTSRRGWGLKRRRRPLEPLLGGTRALLEADWGSDFHRGPRHDARATNVLETAVPSDGASARYASQWYSRPRPAPATVAVERVERLPEADRPVYDVEVEGTHTFATTGGIVVHNCIGVPTVGGEVTFDPGYAGNPLVNAMCVGIVPVEQLTRARASGPGNPLLLVGADTGRDGIQGAAFASNEDPEASHRGVVQVGNPFLEKLLLEACLAAIADGQVLAMQDLGAAGLTSSSIEMAARGGGKLGVEIDVARVPRREQGLTPFEVMLSESQERMLVLVERDREAAVRAHFARWELHAEVVGQVTADGLIRVLDSDGLGVVAELPVRLLTDEVPAYELRPAPPVLTNQQDTVSRLGDESNRQCASSRLDADGAAGPPGEDSNLQNVLCRLLASPNLAARASVFRQYDSTVQGNTVFGPGQAAAAVLRVEDRGGDARSQGGVEGARSQGGVEDARSQGGGGVRSHSGNGSGRDGSQETIPFGHGNRPTKGLALTTDCNPRYTRLDPRRGAQQAVAEAARNLACVGALPIAVTDCLNFGNPEKETVAWQLVEAVEGLAEACRALDVPVVSGNVSLYNETAGRAIPPTPAVGMVGLLEDVTRAVPLAFPPGCRVVLLGQKPEQLSAGEYLAVIQGQPAGPFPRLDLDAERRLGDLLRRLAERRLIGSAQDVSDGGLAVALAESCFPGHVGAHLQAMSKAELFSEDQGRALVTCCDEDTAKLLALAAEHGVPAEAIGWTGGDRLIVEGALEAPVAELRAAWEGGLT